MSHNIQTLKFTKRSQKFFVSLSSILIVGSLSWSQAQAIDLNTTIEDAVLHNPEYKAQVKAYQGIQAELKGAKGGWYPKVDIGMGTGVEDLETRALNTSLNRNEASIRLTQNLFAGYGTENEIKRQQARLDASGYTAIAKANQIALDMSEAYINLMKQQELVRLSEENRTTHERILDQITQRSAAGIGNQVEVDQAKARLALANSNLMAANNNYRDALSKFERILGRLPENDLIKPDLNYTFPKSLEEATNIALLNHPTLNSANADIAEARAQHEAAKRFYYPTVDLEVQKTFDNNISGIEGKNEDFQAMIRMRYNLYNGGIDSANRERTGSAVQQAAEIRNNSRRQTIENLRYAWDAKKYVGEQLTYVQQHIKLTHETLEGYRKQFSLGRRSLLDLLNTEDEYISALRTLVESESEYKIAEYRILNGMGELLDVLNIQLEYTKVDKDYTTQ